MGSQWVLLHYCQAFGFYFQRQWCRLVLSGNHLLSCSFTRLYSPPPKAFPHRISISPLILLSSFFHPLFLLSPLPLGSFSSSSFIRIFVPGLPLSLKNLFSFLFHVLLLLYISLFSHIIFFTSHYPVMITRKQFRGTGCYYSAEKKEKKKNFAPVLLEKKIYISLKNMSLKSFHTVINALIPKSLHIFITVYL